MASAYAAYANELIGRWFGIDLRTLALMRILMAGLLLADLAVYWSEAEAFFGESGIFPIALAKRYRPPEFWSLYYLREGMGWAAVVSLATVIAACMLMLGYRTRLAAVLNWVGAVSLTNRFSLFASGADMQYCAVLFWLLFLPMGARFSVDEALNRREWRENRFLSVATVGLLLQVTYLYLIGALLKTGEHWRQSLEAVYYALNAVQLSTPLAHWLTEWPQFMRFLTHYVFHLEYYVVFLLFLPFWTVQARGVALVLLMSLHLGFLAFLSIGLFPFVSLTALLCFVPGEWWDGFLPRWNRRSARRGIAIYYDRGCDFCRKLCLIFRALGLPRETPVEPAQQNAAMGALLEKENSWIVQAHDGRLLLHWEAVAYVWRRSPLLWPLGVIFSLPGMRWLGRKMYGMIARHRGRLAQLSAWLLPWSDRQPVRRLPRWGEALLAVLLVTVLLWNLQQVYARSWVTGSWERMMQLTRLVQTWNMFAPQPTEWSRWTVVEGHLADGRVVDVLFERDEPPNIRPENGWGAYPNFRWRKYFSRFDQTYHQPLGEYFCHGWPGREALPSPLRKLVVAHYVQPILLPGQEPRKPARRPEMDYTCR